MRKFYEYGGIAASVILIAFGIASIAMGLNGRDTVRDNLAKEQIVGTSDMKGVANKKVDTGTEARQFAEGMRVHALEASGGQTYAQMGRFLDKNGKPTSDEKAAAVDPKSGKPVENPARQVWVTETALATALNQAYFGENVANFAIVMGIALLLSGIGFSVLTLKALRPAQEPKARAEVREAEPALTA
jgi:hypothetical protein